MVCPRCGAPVATGQPQCMNCGLPLVRVSTRRPGVITFLAVLHFLGGLVTAAAAIYVANFGRGHATPIASWIAIGVAVGAMFNAAMAYGLISLRSWGRTLQIVICFIGLLAFHLGTIVSVMLLMYFFKPGVRALFSGRPPEQFTQEEMMSLQQVQSSGRAIIVVIVIVLVLNVASIGILAAIALPNYLRARDRAYQVKVLADLTSISTGIRTYQAEHDGKTPPGTTLADVAPNLPSAPSMTDPWGNPYRYESDGQHFWLGSAGKDGKWEKDSLHAYSRGKAETADADIVVQDGEFVQEP